MENEVVKRIQDYALEEIMGLRFGAYAKEIIQDRAIPDVRDGLKPVQRRILVDMYKNNNTYDKENVKALQRKINAVLIAMKNIDKANNSFSLPSLWPRTTKPGLHEFSTTCTNVSWPCPFLFQQWRVEFATFILPVSLYVSSNIFTFLSLIADASVTILNVEPGSKLDHIAKFLLMVSLLYFW